MVNTKILQIRPDDAPDMNDPKNWSRRYKRAVGRHKVKQGKNMKKLQPVFQKRNARYHKIITENLAKTILELKTALEGKMSSTDRAALEDLLRMRETQAADQSNQLDVTGSVHNSTPE